VKKCIQFTCLAALVLKTSLPTSMSQYSDISSQQTARFSRDSNELSDVRLKPPLHQVQITSPDDPQLARFSYDVVSVKPFKEGPHANPEWVSGIRDSHDGTEIRNLPVEYMVATAFDTGRYPKVIGPEWIKNDTFEVQAKMDADLAEALAKMSAAEQKLARQHMLQVLMAEYFKVKVHIETKEAAIYQLVTAKGGPKMEVVTDPNATPARMLISRPTRDVEIWKGNATPIAMMLGQLTYELGRPVYDKTGLLGLYNFTLKCEHESHAMSAPSRDATATVDTPAVSDTPPLDTALEEQLGLKLLSLKGFTDLIVIDHVEKPVI
jgi:uncharacterized protein (TIGR03435 family)